MDIKGSGKGRVFDEAFRREAVRLVVASERIGFPPAQSTAHNSLLVSGT